MIILIVTLTRLGVAADSPSLDMLAEKNILPLSYESEIDFSDEGFLLSESPIERYQGGEVKENFEEFTKFFPDTHHLKIAVVGGSLFSGLGKLNEKVPDVIKPFYLINKRAEKGVDSVIDWTTSDLPSDLVNQFHLIILEQVEPDTLINTQVFVNAYQALKPGGILLFNTYRPSDFYIEYLNAVAGGYKEEIETYDMMSLKTFYDGIEAKKERAAKVFFYYFANRLKHSDFVNISGNLSESLIHHQYLFHSSLFRNFLSMNGDPYNSGGWIEAHKKSDIAPGAGS
jgi:hypothetical protein